MTFLHLLIPSQDRKLESFVTEHCIKRYRKQLHTELDTSGLLMFFPFYTVAAALDLDMELFHGDMYESKRRTGLLLHGFILCCHKIMDVNIRSTLTLTLSLLRKI